ncbi:amino acid adenylation domain-containing protein, partial [Clostridia bacterium OttesenSCG-928-F22]|nr:amino acid adenylation domain-containing protein [Clostridia bacterium OttesenSCG-928-F22]
KDYAYFQQNEGKKKVQAQQEYWQQWIKQYQMEEEFPTDKPRQQVFDFHGDTACFELDEEWSKRLEEYCAEQELSPYAFFVAAIGIVLNRISPQAAVVVGSSVAGRVYSQTQDVLGPFVNTLPIRLSPHAKKTIAAYQAEVKQEILGLLEHQLYPLEEIVKMAGVERSLSRNPVFQILLSYRPLDADGFEIGGQPVTYLPIHTGISKMDMNIEIIKQGGRFSFQIEYATALFHKETIQLYGRSIETVAKQLAGNEKETLGDVLAISPRDRMEMIERPFYMRAPYEDACIDVMFERIAQVYPQNAAIVFHGQTVTYWELKERSDALAALLLRSGAQPCGRIAFCIKRGVDMIAAMLAIAKTGCTYVPLLSSLPEKRMDYMLLNSRADILLCDAASRHELSFTPTCRVVLTEDAKAEPFAPIMHRSTEGGLYVLYTSGSTGQPKGVLVQHRAIANLLGSLAPMLQQTRGNVLCTTTAIFDTFITETILPLLLGKCVVMADEEEMMLPWKIANIIQQHDISLMQLTPSRLQMCLSNEEFSGAVGGLEWLLLAGEALGEALLHQLQQTGPVRIVNMYGPTEAAVYASAVELTARTDVTIGRPLNNCRLYVLDEHQQPVLPTAWGELYIAGECLALEYVEQIEHTQKMFVPDVYFPGERMYKTGDIVRMRADGEFVFRGRVDSQVKLNGQRIELEEISGEIARFENIAQVATVPINQGETVAEIRAFIVPKAGAEMDVDALLSHLRKNLPSYMVPSKVVVLNDLPRTPSGKTDIRALQNHESKEKQGRIIRATLAEEIRGIWEDILQTTTLDTEVSFFEQGGTSLAALNVLSRYYNRGWPMTLAQFYKAPTLVKQVELLGKGASVVVQEQHSEENSGVESKEKELYRWVPKAKPIPADAIKTVLLTGATGYLGTHLLKELIEAGAEKVYCLCRGEGDKKLREALGWYFGSGWQWANEGRLEVICGDVQQEQLGIPEAEYEELLSKVSLVVHAAADVRHYAPEEDSLGVNYHGTARVIQFAKKANAALLHISTTSITGEQIDNSPDDKVFFGEEDCYIGQNWQDNIYIKGKMLAEQLVYDAVKDGLPAKVCRVGRLVGRRADGIFQQNPQNNLFFLILNTIGRLQVVPKELLQLEVEVTPVDECAKAIVLLLGGSYTTYHVFNPETLLMNELLEKMQLDTKEYEADDFLAFMEGNISNEKGHAAMVTLKDTYQHMVEKPARIHPTTHITQQELKNLGFVWQQPDIPVVLRAFVRDCNIGIEGGTDG